MKINEKIHHYYAHNLTFSPHYQRSFDLARESISDPAYTSYAYWFICRTGNPGILDNTVDISPHRKRSHHASYRWKSPSEQRRSRGYTEYWWSRTICPLCRTVYFCCSSPPLLCQFSRCSTHSLECLWNYCGCFSRFYDSYHFYRIPPCPRTQINTGISSSGV